MIVILDNSKIIIDPRLNKPLERKQVARNERWLCGWFLGRCRREWEVPVETPPSVVPLAGRRVTLRAVQPPIAGDDPCNLEAGSSEAVNCDG